MTFDSRSGGLRTDTLSRVFESRTSTSLPKLATRNWPHGDQLACELPPTAPALAVHEFHEVGIPATTFGAEE